MKLQKIANICRAWPLTLVIALLLLPEGAALAIPRDPPPRPEVAKGGQGELRVARRRRRRRPPPRRRPPRRRPPTPAPEPAPEPAAEPTPDSDLSTNTSSGGQVDPNALRRGGRVEFDGRLVQGQTAKSGAIYLFARKRSELKSMVEERVNFRKEVLRTVYPQWSKEAK